ncbi:MAG: xanthine dehydrogenase family protein subunit M [Pseudomonadota bacterium]
MKPAPFTYHAPRSVAEAIQAIGTLDDAKVLAGGQSLMPMMNMRFVSPAHVVDVNRIPELVHIGVANGRIEVGAMVRHAALLADGTIRRHCPLMAEALAHVGHVQTRSRGTIGGSLCHLDPAAELPVVASALDAVLTVQGPQGTREVPFAQWPLAYMTPDLAQGELLTRISLPVLAPRQGQAFVEFARRHGDFAIACVAAVLTLDARSRIAQVTIAVGGVCATVVRLAAAEADLRGQAVSADAFTAAARHAHALDSADDAYYSADYRRELTSTLVARALGIAAARAAQDTPQ